nr:DUF3093 family protein [Micromonospora sp. DSM 115978]
QAILVSVDSDTAPGSSTTSATGSTTQTFSERLTVPAHWHVGAVVFAGLAGSHPGAYLDHPWARAAAYLAVFVVVEVGLWWYGQRVLLASDGVTFSVAGRGVPASRVAGVTVVDDIRSVLVPNTYAVTRPWIRGGVLLTLHDAEPDDLGWVLSSRRGQELAAALASARPAEPATGESVG